MTGWQPIETAPDDEGVWILVWLAEPVLGSRVHAMRRGTAPLIGTGFAWDRPKAVPTHWQPFPAPPSPTETT